MTQLNEKFEVLEDLCTFSPDYSRGMITVKSHNPELSLGMEELSGSGPQKLAMGFAAKNGMSNVSVNGNTIGPYPVNAKNENTLKVTGEDNKPLPDDHERKKIVAYCVDIPVSQKFMS